MRRGAIIRLVSVLVCAGLLTGGSVNGSAYANETGKVAAAVEKKDENVFKGKITGVSKKAKSITIVVGKGDKKKMVMVKFDDSTKGLDHAKKGEAAIVHYEMRGVEKFATVVKPKLAKLPKGVVEMQPDELIKLVAIGPEKGGYFLVDSRPAKPFAAGHVPYAVSIPVEVMVKNGAELLPGDKDFPLIFYCGGPT